MTTLDSQTLGSQTLNAHSAGDTLDGEDWRRLIHGVFEPRDGERSLALLVDLPDARRGDNEAWQDRRRLAQEWRGALTEALASEGFRVELWLYRNAHTNNGDLPSEAWPWQAAHLPSHVDQLAHRDPVPMVEIFARFSLLIALSEFSATAPLKIAAKMHGFRAATMPRFSRAMVPALRLDFAEIDRRCRLLKTLLDDAIRADFTFEVLDATYRLTLDLRHRHAHVSSGLIRSPGSAGNLPSGETYIVPYEGEVAGDPSGSQGSLPVAFDDQDGHEVVVYEIFGNRAVTAFGNGPVAARERQLLAAEPAYANLAELGLGVLGDLGVKPLGEILLDEKLGLHIAFGRSDHFGGVVGPADFSSPDAVVHIDRVYLPQMEEAVNGAAVNAAQVSLRRADGRQAMLLRDGRYVLDFSSTPAEIWD